MAQPIAAQRADHHAQLSQSRAEVRKCGKLGGRSVFREVDRVLTDDSRVIPFASLDQLAQFGMKDTKEGLRASEVPSVIHHEAKNLQRGKKRHMK